MAKLLQHNPNIIDDYLDKVIELSNIAVNIKNQKKSNHHSDTDAYLSELAYFMNWSYNYSQAIVYSIKKD